MTTSFSKTNVSCNGGSDGTIDLNVLGGICPYSFLWSNGDTTEDISGIPGGVYWVSVTDSNGCTEFEAIGISEQWVMTTSITSTNVSCNGGSDGSVDLTVSGGVLPYSFSWSNGDTTEDIMGVPAGNYSVIVTDFSIYCAVNSIIISEPALSVSITGTDVSCNNGSDGMADLTVFGGVFPYSFSWSNGNTTEDISNVPAGNYTVIVTDSNGCIATDSVIISEPAVMTTTSISSINVSCNGWSDGSADLTIFGSVIPYSFSWSNGDTTEDISGIPAGNYTVIVTDSNGCTTTDSALITEPAMITTNTPDQTICDGDSALIFGVYQTIAGTYYEMLLSVDGCDSIIATTLIVNPLPTVDLGADTTICNGCSITLDVGAGFTNYSWSNGQITQNIIVDSAGTYSIQVTDTNGCVGTDTIVIDIASGINELPKIRYVSIYPNPNTGVFIIEIKNLRGFQNLGGLNMEIKLLNTTGQVIYAEKLYPVRSSLSNGVKEYTDSYRKEIDMKNYPKGIYNLLVISDSGTINNKVVLE